MDIYSFVYRGVLADEAVRQHLPGREAEGKQPDHDIQRRLPLEAIDDALVAVARKMAWVYTAIAAFENSVRIFIEGRLLEKTGAAWWDTAVSSSIKEGAERRKRDEEQIRWHGSRGSSPLAYVQLEDLAVIIQNNHAHFQDMVPTVEWAREIFRSLTRSRNVIMHSGQLTLADVERVAMNIRDWTRQVGG
ncbi:MAG: hypothetical protein JNL08_07015 [Planctomycetes bacterium]|nr:hypothetical protein [Planctomycetota bacterium]